MGVSPFTVLRRRSDWLLALLPALVVFYAFGDFTSTVMTMEAGGVELNPVPRFIIHELGYGWFLVAKLAESCFLIGVCILFDVWSPEPLIPADWRRVRWAYSKLPIAIAAVYSLTGLYLTVSNALVYVSLTTS